MALSAFSEPPRPAFIIDLLQNAANTHPENGFLYLENGISEPATKITFPQLYAQAKVGEILFLECPAALN